MKRSLLPLLMLVLWLPIAPSRAEAATIWISPGESRTVGCWSLPLTTPVQRVNFANLRGPGVSYRVTVRKSAWTSGWPWAWWSWTGSFSPLQMAPSTVSASFVTQPGADYHLQLRGLEGVGYASCVVTLTQATAGLSKLAPEAGSDPDRPSEAPVDTSMVHPSEPLRSSWGLLKARYR